MSNDPKSAQQQLYDIAMEADVSIERLDGECLEDFADRLVDEILEKINYEMGLIQDVRNMPLDNEEDAA